MNNKSSRAVTSSVGTHEATASGDPRPGLGGLIISLCKSSSPTNVVLMFLVLRLVRRYRTSGSFIDSKFALTGLGSKLFIVAWTALNLNTPQLSLSMCWQSAPRPTKWVSQFGPGQI